MTQKLRIISLAIAAIAWLGCGAAWAQESRDEVEVVQKSIDVLRNLTKTPDNDIPQYLLERAEAIVVIPNLIKGGFIIGGKHGKGVVSVRDRGTNTWSPPAFVRLTGGSIGWQIGVESVDLVLLVMNTDGVKRLLENKFTFGGDLSVAAGPVGRNAAAGTDARITSQILAYSRSKGLFAGATFEGAALHADEDDNQEFYGRELGVREIVLDRAPNTKPPAIAATWSSTLKSLTAKK